MDSLLWEYAKPEDKASDLQLGRAFPPLFQALSWQRGLLAALVTGRPAIASRRIGLGP